MNGLLIAPGASSQDVGEVLVAYRIAEHLVQHFDVTLITIDRVGRPSVVDESLFKEVKRFKETPGLHIFERFNSMAKPWYPKFFWQARRWIKKRLKQGHAYDWIHQINPCAIRYPSPACGLGIPYSLGPVAGGLPNIESFANELKAVSWYMKLRVFDDLLPKFVPLLSRTYREASLVFPAAPYVQEILQRRFGIRDENMEIMDELGIFEVNEHSEKVSAEQVKLLYVGRVVRTKGAQDLVKAISLLPDELNIHLDIIGDGDDLPACKSLAAKLELNHRITFHGRLPRDAIDAYYKAADIFTFPSFREPTGGVLVEAMSYGLPMVVADYGGPQSIVKDNFGRKVVPKSLDTFAKGIADAIDELSRDAKTREMMSAAALEHCRKYYIWDKKIAHFAQIIKQRCNDAAERRSTNKEI